jgi:aminoglycoside/choline kinase family phosphotransferase
MLSLIDMDMKTDQRLDLLIDWVARSVEDDDVRAEPASVDASFRRYFRFTTRPTTIGMDAPPPQEDCRPFVAIAGYLEKMGLNSPRILAADVDRGFLLLTDLGSRQYLADIEANPEGADALYQDALDALAVMQIEGVAFQANLPPYDEALLRFEMSLFHDWLCETHLGLTFSEDEESNWRTCCDMLVERALAQPKVFVHRDYHSRNLMVTGENNPGILDFQDAVEGSYTYDLVSLLKDCYVKWPRDVIERRAMYFRNKRGLDSISAKDFMRDVDLTGVQRHLKAAGIFARLLHRDGKTGYMKDVPRTLGYITDIADHYDELSFLGDFIENRVLPALEVSS